MRHAWWGVGTWQVGLILAIFSASSATAVVVEFDTPSDLSQFNIAGGPTPFWSGSSGISGGGAFTPTSSHDLTYAAESFALAEASDTIYVSSFFKTGQLEPIASGTFSPLGEVYLTKSPTGRPFGDDSAFAEIRRYVDSDSISAGPLQQGGGSYPGFSLDYPVGTLKSERWYKLGVEYGLTSGNQLSWDIQLEDFGADGDASVGVVMEGNRVTSDTIGLRFDSSLYAGLGANGYDNDHLTAVDRFEVSVPAGPAGSTSIGPTFDATYTPGDTKILSDGETSLLIGGTPGSSSFPEEQTLIEFPLGTLPTNARIESVRLRLDATSSSGSPRIAVTGYEGDGLASLSDGEAAGSLIALSVPESCCDEVVIPLDLQRVQAMVTSGASHLGLRMRSVDTPLYLGVRSDESSFGAGPLLEIDFSSPTLKGDYNGDGWANAADFTVWRDTLHSREDLRADGDGDGQVDEDDYEVWRENYSQAPTPGVVNEGFELSGLTGWTPTATANSDLYFDSPGRRSFDTDGDGSSSYAMAIRAGQDDYLDDEVAGGGVLQTIFLVGGDYEATADIASFNNSGFGNTAPGRFELWLAGHMVDVVDMNGVTISGGETIRDSLSGVVTSLAPGWYDLELRYLRPAVNTSSIYGYFDNIAVTPIAAEGVSAPEPSTFIMTGLVAAMNLPRTRRRR
ncbi:hypothetical protein Mal64_01350 [Pseudobythopirellula maris]|uniref:PEP-CTERM protein-sorting domain-containing protein n=1 Tax=Pseudobythopirellula maris TaxID=2527991 RepID=A0A5C5ZR96_9BACT|nr:hypothetical protein [Pseudobythopirellula maris]TWT89756.1 hypothetical protein Mal64_01350 [Pseudobythopirellula maris]